MMQVIRVCDGDGCVGPVSRQILHCVCTNKCVNTWSMCASVSGCTQHMISSCFVFCWFFLLVCVCVLVFVTYLGPFLAETPTV